MNDRIQTLFDSTFYTWSVGQLTRYSKGLGVNASSNLQESYLNRCMSLGAKFCPENSAQTVRLCVYSPEFESYVGVGISPATSLDGRKNMVCHFMIPQTPQDAGTIYRYPFLSEVPQTPEAEFLIPEKFDFQRILETYGLTKSGRLACFIEKLVDFIATGRGPVIIRVPENALNCGEELMTVITRLLSGFKGWTPNFSERLGFGVNVENNKAQVGFIFTDHDNVTEGDGNGYILTWDEEISDDAQCNDSQTQLFLFLAQCVLEDFSCEKYKGFLNTLYEISGSGRPDLSQLPDYWLRWCMDTEKQVSLQNQPALLEQLIARACDHEWYKELLLQYILQAEELLNPESAKADLIIDLWTKVLLPEMKNRTCKDDKNLLIQAAGILLQDMYAINRGDYEILLRQLPKTVASEVLHHFWEKSDCIQRELKCIATEASRLSGLNGKLEQIQGCIQRYRPLYHIRPDIFEPLTQAGMKWMEETDLETMISAAASGNIPEIFRKRWLENFIKKAGTNDQWNDRLFQDLLNIQGLVHDLGITLGMKQQYEIYENGLWQIGVDSGQYLWIFSYLDFQKKHPSWFEDRQSVWAIITFDHFQNLYDFLEENSQYQSLLNENLSSDQQIPWKCFQVWKFVQTGQKIPEDFVYLSVSDEEKGYLLEQCCSWITAQIYARENISTNRDAADGWNILILWLCKFKDCKNFSTPQCKSMLRTWISQHKGLIQKIQLLPSDSSSVGNLSLIIKDIWNEEQNRQARQHCHEKIRQLQEQRQEQVLRAKKLRQKAQKLDTQVKALDIQIEIWNKQLETFPSASACSSPQIQPTKIETFSERINPIGEKYRADVQEKREAMEPEHELNEKMWEEPQAWDGKKQFWKIAGNVLYSLALVGIGLVIGGMIL